MKNIFKLILVSISLSSFCSVADVSVIVHPSNDVKIKKVDIKKIFLGKAKTFRNGEPATPVNLVDSFNTRREFNKKLLKRSSNQVAAQWSKLEFTGTGTPPENIETTEMLELIANNPEMIGYVESQSVTGDVKVVMTID